jgi:hypothetical protein
MRAWAWDRPGPGVTRHPGSRHWPSAGPLLALCWPSAGPELAPSWPRAGPELAPSWPRADRPLLPSENGEVGHEMSYGISKLFFPLKLI